ncbi:MAG: hypothetical protein QXR14_09630 [Sulfolobales archaeon]
MGGEGGEAIEELLEDRRRNLEDIIRHAIWNAEMVIRMGRRWFEIRDRWLNEAWRADMEMIKRNPEIREALIKSLEVKSKIEHELDMMIEEQARKRITQEKANKNTTTPINIHETQNNFYVEPGCWEG